MQAKYSYSLSISLAIVVTLCLAAGAPAGRAAMLSPGDVAIVAVNTDGDEFAWVAWRTIPAQTVINFTDSSVSNGLFRWTEHLGMLSPGPLRWSSSNVVVAGTVVRWNDGSRKWSLGQASGASMDLSADGDQVIAYTGSIVSNGACAAPWRGDPSGATMVCAVNLANGGWDNVTGGGANGSYVPPGLSVAEGTALHLGRGKNAYYAGPRRGKLSDLRCWIANPANWTSLATKIDPTNWPSSFEVPRPGTLMILP